jgi:hypothetical protein
MWVVAHWPVEELGSTAGPRPFLQQHHLVHVVAGEPIRGGDQHSVDLAALDRVAQAIETRAGQRGAAIAIVAEHLGRIQGPALGGVRAHMGGQPLDLLLNGLVLNLMAGRDAAVDRYPHDTSPARSRAASPRLA